MNIGLYDTISAISTSLGNGGIGIVRISGKNSIDILKKIFVSAKNKNINDIKSHTINYGHIYNNGNLIDEVLVAVMKSPNTYTREDIVEINCHGGIKSLQKVLETVLNNGARIAEPGEFTKRAFLNGRIDLSQAQAVIDIINSKTELSHQNALKHLEGKLSKKVKKLRNDILNMTAHIEAAIDYPEHDIENITYSTIKNDTLKLIKEIEYLLNTSSTGKIIKEGINTVILGKPNVGKSSLLNYLIDEERAIVTDIPGTTRDILKESININGIALNIIDTAGIRKTNDEIERIGVEMSKKYAKDAELIFMLIDGSKDISDEDKEIFEFIKNKKVIVLINKYDIGLNIDLNELYRYIDKQFVINISVKEDIGFKKLYDKLKDMFFDGAINIDKEVIISNERNKSSLYNSLESLKNVMKTIDDRMPEDFISMDLIEAYKCLGEITGESLEDDIVDKIFSEFCLGK